MNSLPQPYAIGVFPPFCTSGSLAAGVVELSDGRFVLNFLDPAGPGAEAGWVFGTEIISVDGVPISKRIDSLPGSISFQFTKGRTVFAGTQELNLEAKGVTLDVRVPVTVEGEQAKLDGGDPVLDAALVALSEEATRRSSGQLTQNVWQWAAGYDSGA